MDRFLHGTAGVNVPFLHWNPTEGRRFQWKSVRSKNGSAETTLMEFSFPRLIASSGSFYPMVCRSWTILSWNCPQQRRPQQNRSVVFSVDGVRKEKERLTTDCLSYTIKHIFYQGCFMVRYGEVKDRDAITNNFLKMMEEEIVCNRW